MQLKLDLFSSSICHNIEPEGKQKRSFRKKNGNISYFSILCKKTLTEETYKKKYFGLQLPDGWIPHVKGRKTCQPEEKAECSHVEQQARAERVNQKCHKSFITQSPLLATYSNIPPPTMPHLLKFPKQHHQLERACIQKFWTMGNIMFKSPKWCCSFRCKCVNLSQSLHFRHQKDGCCFRRCAPQKLT